MSSVVDTFTAAIKVTTRSEAQDVQDAISAVLHQRLPQVFAAYDDHETLVIDRLEIDLGPVTATDLTDMAERAIAAELQRHWQARQGTQESPIADAPERPTPALAPLLHFLETGRRASHGPPDDLASALSAIDPNAADQVVSSLAVMPYDPVVAERLYRQLQPERIADLPPPLRNWVTQIIARWSAPALTDATDRPASSTADGQSRDRDVRAEGTPVSLSSQDQDQQYQPASPPTTAVVPHEQGSGQQPSHVTNHRQVRLGSPAKVRATEVADDPIDPRDQRSNLGVPSKPPGASDTAFPDLTADPFSKGSASFQSPPTPTPPVGSGLPSSAGDASPPPRPKEMGTPTAKAPDIDTPVSAGTLGQEPPPPQTISHQEPGSPTARATAEGPQNPAPPTQSEVPHTATNAAREPATTSHPRSSDTPAAPSPSDRFNTRPEPDGKSDHLRGHAAPSGTSTHPIGPDSGTQTHGSAAPVSTESNLSRGRHAVDANSPAPKATNDTPKVRHKTQDTSGTGPNPLQPRTSPATPQVAPAGTPPAENAGALALLTRCLAGTLSPDDWTFIANQDLQNWWETEFGHQLGSVVEALKQVAIGTPAPTLAARLSALLPPASAPSVLADLAPAYGGLLGYLVTTTGWDPVGDALTRAALIVALTHPTSTPQAALQDLVTLAAVGTHMFEAALISRILQQLNAGPAHPGQAALRDMLQQRGPKAPDDTAAHPDLSITDPPAAEYAPLWAYLRAGVLAPANDLATLAHAALSTTLRSDIIDVIKGQPAARLRLQQLIGRQEVEVLLPHRPPAAHPRVHRPDPVVRPHQDIPVTCGGLVILWPFLSHYLSSLSLWSATDGFADATAQRRAVLLIHGLATGDHTAAEPDLVMEKLLCGMDDTQPTDLAIPPTETEMELSQSLLDAVRTHWDVLQGSTNATLRSTFLQRPARLSPPTEDGPLTLTPDTGPFDMLLDKLPWQISTVKLPWMPEVLHVSWR